jgi:putative FmdB family regulatory protein
MPIYEYRCQGCGQITEALIRSRSEAASVRCEHCGDSKLERVYLSTIAPVCSSSKGEEVPCCGEQKGCSDPKRCCER